MSQAEPHEGDRVLADERPAAGAALAGPPPGDGTGTRPATTGGDRSSPTRRQTFLVWLVSCLAFTLLGAGWATATPYGEGYDEDSHILRAAGVVYGQLYTPPARAFWDSGGWVRVPASLVYPNRHCMFTKKAKRPPATCLGTPPASHRMVRAASTAARYSPLYYALVGWPMRLSPDMTGIVWSRVVSSLLAGALLAAAFTLGWRYRESWLLPVAVLLIAAPSQLNLAGTINPNGLEIAAAVAFWMALLVLARARVRPTGPALRWVLGIATVAAVPLLTMRQMGPLLALVAVVACAVVARPGRFREVVGLRSVRWLAVGLSLVACLGVAWTFVSGLLDTGDVLHRHIGAWTVLERAVTNRSGDWTRQLVARFYGAFMPPLWTVLLWLGLLAVLCLPGGLKADRRLRYTIAGILVFTFGIWLTLEVRYYNALGSSQQTRYYLPTLAGAILLAASVPWLRPRWAGRFTVLAAVAAAPVQVLALAVMLTVFRNGHSEGTPLHALSGPWQPPAGSYLPLALTALGSLLLIGLAFWWGRLAGRAGDGRVPAGTTPN